MYIHLIDFALLMLGRASPMEDLIKIYGHDLQQYCNFLKFIMFSNLVMFLVSLVGMVPHAITAGKRDRLCALIM